MNDHGFRKASPNGNYMLDTKAPQEIMEVKRCDVCGEKTDTLIPLDTGYGRLELCENCKNEEEVNRYNEEDLEGK